MIKHFERNKTSEQGEICMKKLFPIKILNGSMPLSHDLFIQLCFSLIRLFLI